MSSEQRIYVEVAPHVAGALKKLGLGSEPHGANWLELNDAGLDCRELSATLGVAVVRLSIQTTIEQIWLTGARAGRTVRELLYNGGAWTIRAGAPQAFEDRAAMTRWLKKRRLSASGDGYEIREAFLNTQQPTAEHFQTAAGVARLKAQPERKRMLAALTQLEKKLKGKRVYAVGIEEVAGDIVLRVGTEQELAGRVKALSKQSTLLRKSALARAKGLRWRTIGWSAQARARKVNSLDFERHEFGDEVRSRFGKDVAVGVVQYGSLTEYAAHSTPKISARLADEIEGAAQLAYVALDKLSPLDVIATLREGVELFCSPDDFASQVKVLFFKKRRAFAPLMRSQGDLQAS